MSTTSTPALRVITFGELTTGAWGAAWGATEASVVVGSLGPGAAADVPAPGLAGVAPGPAGLGAPATIEGTAHDGDWTLAGERADLTLSAAGEPAAAANGFDQLCRVRGWIVVGDARHPVDSLGRRGVCPALDPHELGSIRDLSGWFEPGEGLALRSLRSRGARGHDRDVVTAALLAPAGVSATAVAEPRMSTTYAADGRPTRVSLELWLEEEEDGEQYARRFAGEAIGPGAELSCEQAGVHARPLRWHSRGRQGAGVYLLVAPRRLR